MMIEDGRRHVDMLGEGLDHAAARAGGDQRRLDDHGHPHRGVERRLLAPAPMIAQHLAMIGGEDDQRVVIGAELLQRRDHAADMMVELRDQAVIGRARLPPGWAVVRVRDIQRQLRVHLQPLQAERHEGMRSRALPPASAGRQNPAHLPGDTDRDTARRDEGRMRPLEAHMQEPGLRPHTGGRSAGPIRREGGAPCSALTIVGA